MRRKKLHWVWREHIHNKEPISFKLMFRETVANTADSCVVVALVGRSLASSILIAVVLLDNG